ncbi:MAG: PIN domain-containing protein [Deltaproteobacteria bacterium]|nr:PIN domain-containing protein [Deltaproteobacteria bacterium]
MEKLKVFLDSNVIFSAAYSGKEKSRSYLFFELQTLNIIKIYISNLVKFESIHNIKIKKPEKLDFLNELLSKADIIEDVDVYYEFAKNLPENDRIILSSAIYHDIDFFITGNTKDFLTFYNKKLKNTLILTPKDFLELTFEK